MEYKEEIEKAVEKIEERCGKSNLAFQIGKYVENKKRTTKVSQ